MTHSNTLKTSELTAGKAIKRGLDFIYGRARTPAGFDSYGGLLICCFALVGATSRDAALRQMSRSRANKLAQRWKRVHHKVPPNASPELIFNFLLVRYALGRLGIKDSALTEQIRSASTQFSAQDLLGFDPFTEPPAEDVPFRCDCGHKNLRGRTFCKQCRRRLVVQSRYRIWMAALVKTYVGERCGIVFGAPYPEVLKWLPAMRPYPTADDDVELLRDAIFAVTHVVYTLNDYSTYRLSRRWLPEEFAYLKTNVAAACERNDPEVLGELLDSLKSFGLRASHPLMKRGTSYLLAQQNKDGSWGDPDEENIRIRCHTTWTALDALRTYAWSGERLSRPEAKSMLKRWVR